MRGNTDCVRHLLTIPGIDVNAPNAKGESPLNIATQKGYADLAELLRTAGPTESKISFGALLSPTNGNLFIS
ncbi:MAG: ankyrin repeat domain-containing protein [Akkermansia sp.]|nr:ankyrin repeat domain-containing protein [Akkermansia sp.]